MEDRQQRLNAEREERIKEEKAQEVRIFRQRQLELERLERERRNNNGSGDTASPITHALQQMDPQADIDEVP